MQRHLTEKRIWGGEGPDEPIQSALETGLAKASTVVAPGQCWTATSSAIILLLSKKQTQI